MNYSPLNFSMSDRIESAKTSTTNKNNTDQVPVKNNAKPGETQLSTNTSDIDSIGTQVNSKQNEANNATSPSKAKEQTGETGNLTYERQSDPEFPNEKDPGITEPKPKNKTFTERLLDSQTQSMMSKNSGQPENKESTETEYPKDQAKDINKPQPTDNTPSRPKTAGFNPASIKSPNPKQPPGTSLTGVPQDRPGVALGPKYTSPEAFKPQNIKIRPISPPRFK